MSSKRSWKLQEFVGHGSLVTCASLGHKSGRVMATGGEDGKVNLWHVGSTNCIMSLPSLTSAVEAVQFNSNEQVLCAGSRSGVLRIWNLTTSKVIRHLTGHKAAIRCIDFHPYGEFLTSCSDDHKVRMWDIRRKGCIYTYKDHADKVNQVQFSPDGKWIAATSDDNTCKLWDITAGKLVQEFKDHTGPVKCLHFHPSEFLLATGSSDRTSKVYDVERFKMLTSTQLESNAIEKVMFADTGEYIYTASQDCFKIYSWEPTCQHLDTVLAKWGKPSDITVSGDQMIACTSTLNIVSVYAVDLKSLNLQPNSSSSTVTRGFPASQSSDQFPVQKPTTQNRRLTYVASRPHTSLGTTSSNTSATKTSSTANTRDDRTQSQYNNNNSESVLVDEAVDQTSVFKPRKVLARSPTKSVDNEENITAEGDKKQPATPKPQHPVPTTNAPAGSSAAQLAINFQSQSSSVSPAETQQNKPSQDKPTPSPVPANPASPIPTQTPPVDPPKISVSTPCLDSTQKRLSTNNTKHISTRRGSEPLGGALNWQESANDRVKQHHQPKPQLNIPPSLRDENIAEKPGDCGLTTPPPVAPNLAENLVPSTPASDVLKVTTVNPMESQNTTGLDMNAFLPARKDLTAAEPAAANDKDVVSDIRKGLESMRIVLTNRHKNLEIVRALWTTGDIMTSINTAMKMDDQALVVDLLNVLIIKPSLWSLDLCLVMLPHIKILIMSKYETYVTVGINSLKLVLRNFVQVIRSNLRTPPPGGVDISRAERHQKCKECHANLADIRQVLEAKQQTSGKIGSHFRELKLLISSIE